MVVILGMLMEMMMNSILGRRIISHARAVKECFLSIHFGEIIIAVGRTDILIVRSVQIQDTGNGPDRIKKNSQESKERGGHVCPPYSLRQWYKGMAMAAALHNRALLKRIAYQEGIDPSPSVARFCGEVADALLAEDAAFEEANHA